MKRIELWSAVADDLKGWMRDMFRENGQAHAPSILFASAALTGESALLAVETELPETGAINSRKAMGVLLGETGGPPSVWDFVRMTLSASGVDLSSEEALDVKAVNLAAAVAVSSGKTLGFAVGEELLPRQDPYEACIRVRRDFANLISGCGLARIDAPFCAATVMLQALVGLRRAHDPKILARAAMETMLIAVRSVPPLDAVGGKPYSRFSAAPEAAAPAEAPEIQEGFERRPAPRFPKRLPEDLSIPPVPRPVRGFGRRS